MVTLNSPANVPAAVEAVVGFTPTDSLVILALGGGPSARVDIDTTSVVAAVQAFGPAAAHWTDKGVAVALYSETVDVADVEAAILRNFPAVPIRLIVTVDEHDVVTDHEGNQHRPTLPAGLPARVIRPSRESLIADAERVTSASAAWTTARDAYLDGDGAKAWIYLDRFLAINGETTAPAIHLTVLLEQAVDPKSVMGQTIVGR